MSTIQYAIIGRRPNGEVLHYVSDATQGSRFVPSSHDRAYIFTDSDYAEVEAENLQRQYRGLAIEIERRAIPVDMETIHRNAMTDAFGDHGQG